MDIYAKIDELGEYIDQAKVLPIIKEKLLDTDYLMRSLGEIYAAIPAEIKEAKTILSQQKERELAIERHAEELMQKTKEECERLLNLARLEARKLTDEHEIRATAEQQAKAIQEQVLEGIESMRHEAVAELESFREEALEKARALEERALAEAKHIKDSADEYAEEVLARLEETINQMQGIGKNTRKFFTEHRESGFGLMS